VFYVYILMLFHHPTRVCSISASFRSTDSILNYNTYLAGAVGLEGAQHRGGFKEKLPNAEGREVLIPLVQSHLYGVLQALCESEWA
jgi:hypothetical protein